MEKAEFLFKGPDFEVWTTKDYYIIEIGQVPPQKKVVVVKDQEIMEKLYRVYDRIKRLEDYIREEQEEIKKEMDEIFKELGLYEGADQQSQDSS